MQALFHMFHKDVSFENKRLLTSSTALNIYITIYVGHGHELEITHLSMIHLSNMVIFDVKLP